MISTDGIKLLYDFLTMIYPIIHKHHKISCGNCIIESGVGYYMGDAIGIDHPFSSQHYLLAATKLTKQKSYRISKHFNNLVLLDLSVYDEIIDNDKVIKTEILLNPHDEETEFYNLMNFSDEVNFLVQYNKVVKELGFELISNICLPINICELSYILDEIQVLTDKIKSGEYHPLKKSET